MRYIADTTFLIDLVNGDKGAVELAEELDSTGEGMALSAISVEEYIRGVYFLFSGKKLKEKLRAAKGDLAPFTVIPVDEAVAFKAAEIDASLAKEGLMLSLADILIAATALANNLVLVTRNVKHFKRVRGLKVRRY